MKRKIIALTGYIGSGKSSVASILHNMGYKTVDCDQIAREISTESDVVQQVAKLLGTRYVQDGKLDRAAIRERVFADGELLSKYQALFFDKVKERLVSLVAQTEQTLFVEIAVIDAFSFDWDEIWCVVSDVDKLVDRVTRRDGVSAASVSATLSKQKPFPCPTRTVVNNSTLSALETTVRTLLQQMD